MEIQELEKAINIVYKTTEKAKLKRLVSLTMIRILLYIAMHPACTQKEIQKDLKLPIGSMSQYLRALAGGGSTSTTRKDGFNLIKEVLSFSDYRRKEYFLNEKGLKVITQIKNI